MLLAPPDSLDPFMTWTWPVALKQGFVPLSLFARDHLRRALGTQPTSLQGAIEEYWQSGEFVAARKAAETDEVLRQEVAERLQRKKNDLQTAHAALIEEAESYRAEDNFNEYIDRWLKDIDGAFQELQFDKASGLFKELAILVHQARLERDPVRLSLIEFLNRAGSPPSKDIPREELQRQVDALRKENEMRRLHLSWRSRKRLATRSFPRLFARPGLPYRGMSIGQIFGRPTKPQ